LTHFDPILADFDHFGVFLTPFWLILAILDPFWPDFGQFWPFWGHFWPKWGDFGPKPPILDHFWPFSAHFWPKRGYFWPLQWSSHSTTLDSGVSWSPRSTALDQLDPSFNCTGSGVGSSGGGHSGGPDLGSNLGGPKSADFGVILRVENSSKTAQFVVFCMLLHMYNMYLYTPYNIYICTICDNMLNTAEYVLWGVPHGVVGGHDGRHPTVDGMIYTA
jgi:hypothetical protein